MQAQVPPKVSNFYQLMLHHVTEKLNVHQDCCEDLQHHTALEDQDVVCHCTLHILNHHHHHHHHHHVPEGLGMFPVP
jgi:hypothetical protein